MPAMDYPPVVVEKVSQNGIATAIVTSGVVFERTSISSILGPFCFLRRTAKGSITEEARDMETTCSLIQCVSHRVSLYRGVSFQEHGSFERRSGAQLLSTIPVTPNLRSHDGTSDLLASSIEVV